MRTPTDARNSNSYKTVLFDLDGTLTDSSPGIIRCLRGAIANVRPDFDFEQDLKPHIGPPIETIFSVLLNTEDQGLIQDAIKHYRSQYSEFGWEDNSVYTGIPDLLAGLCAHGFRLGVATSKAEVFAERILAHFGLASYFEVIGGSTLDGKRSRKSEVIGHVLEVGKFDPLRTLMVGDRSHDVHGAKSHNIECLGVTWGYGSYDELESSGAAAITNSPEEILSFVLNAQK